MLTKTFSFHLYCIGIGGLGCFSCGAKGKENFVMDRDRIVEDGKRSRSSNVAFSFSPLGLTPYIIVFNLN
jgi:hypothetical protein